MGFSNSQQWLNKRPWVIACAITLTLILWMLTGVTHTLEAPSKNKQTAPVAKVQITPMQAQNIHSTLELYGRTAPNRSSTLKAEIRGKVLEVFALKGSRVQKGDVIIKIEANDLEARLASSQALLKQRNIELNGAKALKKNGNIGRSQLAKAQADIESVKAQIKGLTIQLQNTLIRAPFDGALNTRHVEVGDYLKLGDPVALITDLSTLVVTAYATENQVNQLAVGQTANIRLLKQPTTTGHIRYIASLADKATNTFLLEVEIPNPDYKYRAGISSEVAFPLKKQWAIKLSPALLALDEAGNIGVKSVIKRHVVFTPIRIIKSDPDGIWLSGLGKKADIISLGQGFVRAGDPVDPIEKIMDSKGTH